MTSPKTQPTTVFDKNGDLTLRVSEPPADFRVASTALTRASPVFDRMLNGGFSESRTGKGDWVVCLPGDGAEEMRIFLAIIHSEFADVPGHMPLSRLHRLLSLTSKYDVTAKVRPWAARWLAEVKNEVEDPRLLAVAWELGEVHTARKMVRKIAYECRVGRHGNLTYGMFDLSGSEPNEDASECDDGDSGLSDDNADRCAESSGRGADRYNCFVSAADTQYVPVIPGVALGKTAILHSILPDHKADKHRQT